MNKYSNKMKIKINNKNMEFKKCRTFFDNFWGLMFSEKKNIMLVAPFESKAYSSIHSLFVFYSFSAIFLNSKKEVVDHKRMNPFTFYTPKKAAKYVLETHEELKHIDKKLKF